MDLFGINEDELLQLSNEILIFSNDLNSILSKVSNLIEETEVYFKCDTGDKFRNQYNLLKANFATVKSNFDGYSSQLVHLRNVHKNFDSDVSAIVLKDAVNVGNWRG